MQWYVWRLHRSVSRATLCLLYALLYSRRVRLMHSSALTTLTNHDVHLAVFTAQMYASTIVKCNVFSDHKVHRIQRN